jgi:cell division protein FtsB
MWSERIRGITGGPRSRRRALTLALASAGLFTIMAVLWLSVSTRAAILNQQLDALEARRAALEREITEIQEQIGDATSAQIMEQRMRAAGFQEPEDMRFLLVPTPAAPVTATTTMTTTIESAPAQSGSGTGGDQ